jgi:hypothetical protein
MELADVVVPSLVARSAQKHIRRRLQDALPVHDPRPLPLADDGAPQNRWLLGAAILLQPRPVCLLDLQHQRGSVWPGQDRQVAAGAYTAHTDNPQRHVGDPEVRQQHGDIGRHRGEIVVDRLDELGFGVDSDVLQQRRAFAQTWGAVRPDYHDALVYLRRCPCAGALHRRIDHRLKAFAHTFAVERRFKPQVIPVQQV